MRTIGGNEIVKHVVRKLGLALATTVALGAPAAGAGTVMAAQKQQPQRGGTLKVAVTADANSLGDPTRILMPQDYVLSQPSLEPLAVWGANGQLQPWLATKWSYNAKDKTITIHLRKGVKFQDGTPFNAQAVRWQIQQYIKSKSQPALAADVSAILTPDPYTVELDLKEWNITILNQVLVAERFASPTAFQKHGADWALTHPVGTGPFKLASWNRGVEIKYVKNNNYWQKGKPYVNAIDFRIIQDPTTAEYAFQSGEVQVYLGEPNGIPATQAADLQKKAVVVKLNQGMGAVEQGIIFDSGNPKSPFANVKVRQAVAYAIDVKAIAQQIYKGYLAYTNQIGMPGSWAYNPAVKGYPYNPQKAKQLLSQAGYPNGFSTTYTIQNDPVDQQVGTAVQSYLAAVGIKVNLQPVDLPKFFAMTSPGGSGWSGLMQWGMKINPEIVADMPRDFEEGALYPSQAHPKKLKEMLDQAAAQPTSAQEQQVAKDIQKYVIDTQCLVVPFGVNTMPSAKSAKVHDDGIDAPSAQQWFPSNVWISK